MKRLTVVLVALAAASPAAFCVQRAPKAQTRRPDVRLVTREVPLGRVPAGELKEMRTVSPDRRHVAYAAKVRGGEVAYVDGRAGKTYPAIANDPISEAGLGKPFTFSRDGRHAAYVARLGKDRGPRRVVVDGKEGPVFDYIWSSAPHFSDDGKHFAYTAERGGKRFAIVDGVEYGPYESVYTPAFGEYQDRGSVFAFSATRDDRQLFVVNGQEFAEGDVKGRELFFGEQASTPYEFERDGKHFVAWEGHEVGPFDESVVRMSGIQTVPRAGGGRFVAFKGQRGAEQFAVLDGVVGKPYGWIGNIHLSPGAEHALYEARLGEEEFVVLDGKEGPRFHNVEIEYGATPFSPDGLHHAYAASREPEPGELKFVAVADGKEGRVYDYVTDVTYTPDSAHLLYLAYDRSREKSFLVRDGEEVASYDQFPDSSRIRFSPDGKRMYFRLRKAEVGPKGGLGGVVVDGRAFDYEEVLDVEFSPDGSRVVFKALRGRGWVMVVDGVESELYEPDGEDGDVEWSDDGRLAFSKDGGRLAYVGRKRGKEFVVLDGVAGAKYDLVANLGFSPDGRHVFYTARRAGKSVAVVDGVESREYDAFLPARESQDEGTLDAEGDASFSILARRGAELLRVEIAVVED